MSEAAAKPKPQRYQIKMPYLYPKQEEAIFYPRDKFGVPARFSFIEASTKTGKTVGCILWLFKEAMEGPPGNYWWVAPVSAQAKIAFTRMKTYYKGHVTPLLSPTPTLTLPNGNIIWFKSAEDPDNLYGEDVNAGVFDEASRAREEAWHAFRSTLTATRGTARFIGNVKGRKNWFFNLSRKAEAGEHGYAYYKIIAYDAVASGVLSAVEIEEAKRDLPENVFRELYLAEPSDDGGNPFGMQYIAAAVEPLSTLPPKVWGWDLAKRQDWTVGTGMDEFGRVCRFHRFQAPWEDTTDRIIRFTGSVPALVDSTGVGDPILERLQKVPGTHFEGYHFTQQSKQKLMEGLAVALQKGETKFPDGPIKSEMENFEFTYSRTGVSYSAPVGFHDDCVCSLALAQHHRSHMPATLNLSAAVLARSAQPAGRRVY
jgi:hypothetical protein